MSTIPGVVYTIPGLLVSNEVQSYTSPSPAWRLFPLYMTTTHLIFPMPLRDGEIEKLETARHRWRREVAWTAIEQLAVPACIVLMIGWKRNPNHPDLEADGLECTLRSLVEHHASHMQVIWVTDGYEALRN